MNTMEEEYLLKLAERFKIRIPPKKAQQNPLDNSMWSNILDGAVKGLEMVALLSLDWKLTAIVKLFQSWLKDHREEKSRRDMETQYGVNWEQNAPQRTTPDYSTYY